MSARVPVIDISAGGASESIDAACSHDGFFVITGHGVDPSLFERLEHAARQFFALPSEAKAAIAMANAGPAWRGWFPP